ncbi:MAG: hypothetical protein RIS86_603 [Planctomycetota bacterium]
MAQIPTVPFATPTNLFRFGEQSTWSTALLPTVIANTQTRIFATANGQVGQGFARARSIAEANLKEGGKTPAGVAYDVFGVAAEIVSSVNDTDAPAQLAQAANTAAFVQDALNIQHNVVLSWDFTQTVIDICPVTLAGAGGGLYGALSTTANNTSVGHMSNGNGNIWMYRKHPVALPGNSAFGVLLRAGSRAPALSQIASLRVTLLGFYKNIIEIG